jgi:hypothetical protein
MIVWDMNSLLMDCRPARNSQFRSFPRRIQAEDFLLIICRSRGKCAAPHFGRLLQRFPHDPAGFL